MTPMPRIPIVTDPGDRQDETRHLNHIMMLKWQIFDRANPESSTI
jgi:hypothetical protein